MVDLINEVLFLFFPDIHHFLCYIDYLTMITEIISLDDYYLEELCRCYVHPITRSCLHLSFVWWMDWPGTRSQQRSSVLSSDSFPYRWKETSLNILYRALLKGDLLFYQLKKNGMETNRPISKMLTDSFYW